MTLNTSALLAAVVRSMVCYVGGLGFNSLEPQIFFKKIYSLAPSQHCRPSVGPTIATSPTSATIPTSIMWAPQMPGQQCGSYHCHVSNVGPTSATSAMWVPPLPRQQEGPQTVPRQHWPSATSAMWPHQCHVSSMRNVSSSIIKNGNNILNLQQHSNTLILKQHNLNLKGNIKLRIL